MRVRQETCVEHHVRVLRNTVLVAKGLKHQWQLALLTLVDTVGDEFTQLMQIGITGIDTDIGHVTDGLEQRPLAANGFPHRNVVCSEGAFCESC